jgi:hypothetical protein
MYAPHKLSLVITPLSASKLSRDRLPLQETGRRREMVPGKRGRDNERLLVQEVINTVSRSLWTPTFAHYVESLRTQRKQAISTRMFLHGARSCP